jgi:hypothetical protein
MPKKMKSDIHCSNKACENELDAEIRFSRWNEKPSAIMESFHSFTQPGNASN